MRYTDFKLDEDELFEINMSPTNLKKLAAAIPGALAGLEFEMIVPHMPSDATGSNGNTRQRAADSLKKALGREVHVAGYHGGDRSKQYKELFYIAEPDGSLRAGLGQDDIEFISPPLSIDEMLGDLDKVIAWARTNGCLTGKKYQTALHMNVSVPGYNRSKLDYVKLALLVGDQHVLDKFDRLIVTGSTNWAKSSLGIIVDTIKRNPFEAKQALDRMRSHMEDGANKSLYGGNSDKYESINAQRNRVEFRSPGGDYINDYTADPGKFTNTLLRFVVALDAACDPEKYKKEYQTKLYKLLMKGIPEQSADTVKYFVQYIAGGSTQTELKNFIRAAQTDRVLAQAGTKEKRLFSVKLKGTAGETQVPALGPMDAIRNAIAKNPNWKARADQLANLAVDNWEVKDLGPAPETVPDDASGKFEIYNLTTGLAINHQIPAVTNAASLGDAQENFMDAVPSRETRDGFAVRAISSATPPSSSTTPTMDQSNSNTTLPPSDPQGLYVIVGNGRDVPDDVMYRFHAGTGAWAEYGGNPTAVEIFEIWCHTNELPTQHYILNQDEDHELGQPRRGIVDQHRDRVLYSDDEEDYEDDDEGTGLDAEPVAQARENINYTIYDASNGNIVDTFIAHNDEGAEAYFVRHLRTYDDGSGADFHHDFCRSSEYPVIRQRLQQQLLESNWELINGAGSRLTAFYAGSLLEARIQAREWATVNADSDYKLLPIGGARR